MSASPQPQNAFQRMMQAAKQQHAPVAAKLTPDKPASKRSALKQQAWPQPPTPKKKCLVATPASTSAGGAALSPAAASQRAQTFSGQALSQDRPTPNALRGAAVDAAATAAEAAAVPAVAVTTVEELQADSQDIAYAPMARDPPKTGLHEGAAAQQRHHAAAVTAFKNMFDSSQRPPAQQKFTHLLVYDFEATCNKQRSLQPVEIIELSCAIVDCKAASIINSFQAYVLPTEHPELDPFCIELTGIQQQQVDAAQQLGPVLARHHAWLQECGMFEQGVTLMAVTWTSWDLAICLCAECAWRKIQRPDYLCSWVDLKQQFGATYKQRGNLRTCVEAAGLRWQGRQHSGLDDALNTARLAIKLMQQGVVLEVTQTSENVPLQQQQSQGGASGESSKSRAGSSGGSSDRGRQAAAAAAAAGGTLLCQCGVKAQKRTTKRPGPNHGRQFYSCGTWTITRQQSRGCGFFVWADELSSS